MIETLAGGVIRLARSGGLGFGQRPIEWREQVGDLDRCQRICKGLAGRGALACLDEIQSKVEGERLYAQSFTLGMGEPGMSFGESELSHRFTIVEIGNDVVRRGVMLGGRVDRVREPRDRVELACETRLGGRGRVKSSAFGVEAERDPTDDGPDEARNGEGEGDRMTRGGWSARSLAPQLGGRRRGRDAYARHDRWANRILVFRFGFEDTMDRWQMRDAGPTRCRSHGLDLLPHDIRPGDVTTPTIRRGRRRIVRVG